MTQVDRHGSADLSLGITMQAAARAAGVTRTTVYRHWETGRDFTDDLARFATMVDRGWQRAILDQDPADPIDASMVSALGPPSAPLAPVVRASVSAWPSDAPARQDIAAWERAWLDRFATWLDRHLRARGRRWIHDADAGFAALCTTAWVEGLLVMAAWWGGPDFDDWEDRVPYVALGVATLVDDLSDDVETVPGRSEHGGSDPDPDRLPDPRLSATRQRILAAALEQASANPARPPYAPTPGRVVDLGRLSRVLGVSERRLYDVWPTAADVNTDVLERVLQRLRSEADDRTARALSLCMAQPFATYDRMIISVVAGLLDAGLARAPFTYYAFTLAQTDPDVRRASIRLLQDWLRDLDTRILALLGLAGWSVRRDIEVSDVAVAMFATIMGAHRLGATHPSLVGQTVPVRGQQQPALAAAAYYVFRNLVVDQPVDPPEGPAAAPALADD